MRKHKDGSFTEELNRNRRETKLRQRDPSVSGSAHGRHIHPACWARLAILFISAGNYNTSLPSRQLEDGKKQLWNVSPTHGFLLTSDNKGLSSASWIRHDKSVMCLKTQLPSAALRNETGCETKTGKKMVGKSERRTAFWLDGRLLTVLIFSCYLSRPCEMFLTRIDRYWTPANWMARTGESVKTCLRLAPLFLASLPKCLIEFLAE